MMAKTGKNVGEWSEFYTLLYLLGNKQLVLADKALNPLDVVLPILKVIRHDKDAEPIDFVVKESSNIELYRSNKLEKTFNSQYFVEQATKLLEDIKTNSQKSGAFDIPSAIELLHNLYLSHVTASSDEVTDILMQIHDILTGQEPIVGYSIKSYLGSAPTLFNAGKTTNFVYQVNGLNTDDVSEINAIDTKEKIKDRIQAVISKGGKVLFSHAFNNTFNKTLIMLDSNMPKIIAELLWISYSENVKDCEQLIEILENRDFLHYDSQGIYAYKFKKLLSAKALGMNPSKPWNGYDSVNGGYIVVTDIGDVLAYHLYNRDILEDYLLLSTHLERASTTRHDYGSLYVVGDKVYLNLNLQIRFYTPTQMRNKHIGLQSPQTAYNAVL